MRRFYRDLRLRAQSGVLASGTLEQGTSSCLPGLGTCGDGAARDCVQNSLSAIGVYILILRL